jgi:alpha-amylase/alpha-mannosidase (GH57 family)
MPSLVIHGHFYQPPRENPWTGAIDREASAQPFHNWNERIYHECYRPNAHARIFDNYGRVEKIVNNYARMSFNFGPTLLSWLETYHPKTYARIIAADRESISFNNGHGNAIAQAFHHSILPLCAPRDRLTEMRWGMADFRFRFGREAESIWLPETACNLETLAALIDEGVRYIILSPHQAWRVRPLAAREAAKRMVDENIANDDLLNVESSNHYSDDAWRDVSEGSIDVSVPYRCFHPDGSGRSIVIFFYDGLIARAIAFEGALYSSQTLIERFVRAVKSGESIISVATDGESYGHHFHFGDRCLAHALDEEAARRGFTVTNYAAVLDAHEPQFEVELKAGPEGEGTAWSCAHGVGRWRRDCSCHAGAREGWNQKWRAPLRAAFDLLRDFAAEKFEDAGAALFADVWAARDDYVEVFIGRQRRAEFLTRHAKGNLSEREQICALKLLEMQRAMLSTYTSCGWFFNDISGIETVQVMRYAARALELLTDLGFAPPRAEFLDILAEAKSNVAEQGTGADIFRRTFDSSCVTPMRVAAHIALTGLIEPNLVSATTGEAANYKFTRHDFQTEQQGRLTLTTGHLALEAAMTGERFDYALAAMHFGDIDYYCTVRRFETEAQFKKAADRLWENFSTAALPKMLRLAQEEFGPDEFNLESLLPGGRQRVSEIVFGQMIGRFLEEYIFLYRENRRNIEMLRAAGFPLPEELRVAAELAIGHRFEEMLRRQRVSPDSHFFARAQVIANEAARMGYRLERPAIRELLSEMLTHAVRSTLAAPAADTLPTVRALVELGRKLKIEMNLETAQEAIYEKLQNNGDDPRHAEEIAETALLLGFAPNIKARQLARS